MSNEQNLPKRPLPPQKCATGQHKATCEEGKKVTGRTTPSHPQDSFFSTLDWLDDANSVRDNSQNITKPVQNSECCSTKQSSEHTTHFNSSVYAYFYDLKSFTFLYVIFLKFQSLLYFINLASDINSAIVI